MFNVSFVLNVSFVISASLAILLELPTPDVALLTSEYTSGSITAGVGGGTDPDEITADRIVEVAPKGSDRVDVVVAKAPAPKLTTSGSGASMSVATSGHGATGSGALKSTKASKSTTFTCIGGTEHDTTWPATFASSSIKVTGQIYGPMAVAAKTTAGIERITG